MSRPFMRERLVRFSDCDPAGIVFYPQYFVMLNGLVEDWFNDELGVAYAALVAQRRIGLPTRRLEVDFTAVSRLGDLIALELQVERIGGASLALALRCRGRDDNVQRMAMRQVLVTTSLDSHRAVEIPPDVRAAVERWHAAPAA